MSHRALITVMHRSGLRLAEVLALKVSSIDPDAGTIRVRHGKGNKSRVVGIESGGMAVIQR
jgi:site-specific recombinase XerC